MVGGGGMNGNQNLVTGSRIMNEDRKREEFTRVWLVAEPSISAYVFAAIAGFHDAEDVVQRIAQELARSE